MNKKLIRLTESDLHRIVKESVNRILKETGNTKKRRLKENAWDNDSSWDDKIWHDTRDNYMTNPDFNGGEEWAEDFVDDEMPPHRYGLPHEHVGYKGKMDDESIFNMQGDYADKVFDARRHLNNDPTFRNLYLNGKL